MTASHAPETRGKPPLKVPLCSPRGFCAGSCAPSIRWSRHSPATGAGLCPPRDRAQPLCGREPEVQGRRLRGRARRGPGDQCAGHFSAHGVPKSIPAEAQRRNFFASTPPVRWSPRFIARPRSITSAGREIVLIGHADHPEVVGTIGQLPAGAITLLQSVEEVARFVPRDAASLAYVTQTTLSVDDTAGIVAALKARFPTFMVPTRRTSATPPPTARRWSRRWRRWSKP